MLRWLVNLLHIISQIKSTYILHQKVAAETLIQSYSNLYHQDFTILRYGIHMAQEREVEPFSQYLLGWQWKVSLLQFKEMKQAHRKFIYIEDIALSNVAALSPDAKNQVINLEGPRNISVKEVADTVNELFNGDVEINYVEARPGDYAGKVVSNDKSKNLLSWEPLVDFKEGAKIFLDWYKKIHHEEEKCSSFAILFLVSFFGTLYVFTPYD